MDELARETAEAIKRDLGGRSGGDFFDDMDDETRENVLAEWALIVGRALAAHALALAAERESLWNDHPATKVLRADIATERLARETTFIRALRWAAERARTHDVMIDGFCNGQAVGRWIDAAADAVESGREEMP